jgi:hypothetical protein
MDEKKFSPEHLHELRNHLMQIKNSGNLLWVNKFIAAIDTYPKDSTIAYPELKRDLHLIIDNLSSVAEENATKIANSAKECCRECMFHADDCFINIVFLVFKSIELGSRIEPNKIRPTLRIEAAQKRIAQFTNIMKQRYQERSEPK